MSEKSSKNITRIGVVSDTHVPISSSALPKALLDGLAGVDLIIHAGDLMDVSVLRRLEKIAAVYAVCGNMDSPEVKNILPVKREIKVSHFKIGIIHGSGKASDLHLRMRREFKDVDAIVFGHSHKALKEMVEGVLMFNPGSPTDEIFSNVNTFGILELNGKIKASHVEI